LENYGVRANTAEICDCEKSTVYGSIQLSLAIENNALSQVLEELPNRKITYINTDKLSKTELEFLE
jgi:hypothetical protein